MICPNCNREINSESKFCGFCGKPVVQTQFCTMCGAKLQPGSRFCGICGSPVEGNEAVKAPLQQQEAAAEKIPSAAEAELQALAEEEKRLSAQMALLEQSEQETREKWESMRQNAEKLAGEQTELSAATRQAAAARQELFYPSAPKQEIVSAPVYETVPAQTENAEFSERGEKIEAKNLGLGENLRKGILLLVAAAVLVVAAVVIFGKGKEVKALEAKIDSIGDVTLNDRDAIEAAEKALDALDAKKAAKVENTEDLYAARAAYDVLYAADIAKKTQALQEKIEGIGTVTLESGSVIKSTRNLYDNSIDEVRKGISNYQVLIDAEESFDSLRAAEITQLIDAIGTVTLDSEETIRDAKNAYGDLTSAQKQKVSNYSVLEAAENRLDELKEEQREREKQAALAGLRTKYDKVEQTTWYYPSNYPYYIDTRCFVLPYAGKKDSSSAWLRMVINFTGDSWIFWTKVTFMIDGEKKTFTYDYSDVSRDNDTEVWEFVDIPVGSSEMEFLEKIANSEETIVRFIGEDRQRDFTVSAGDKAAIKQMLTAFKYL